MLIRQMPYDLSHRAQSVILGHSCGSEELVVEPEGAQRVGELPAVQLEQGGDAVDVRTHDLRVLDLEDRLAFLLATTLEGQSEMSGRDIVSPERKLRCFSS